MSRPVVLLVALCLFVFPAHATYNESIAIVGAGFSGLSTAYHLVQKGYTNIVIYEQSFRVGGYAASMRHNNVTHDYSIYGLLSTYWRFIEAMEGIGVTFCELLGDIVNSTSSPPELIPLEKFAERVILPRVGSPDKAGPMFRAQLAKYARIWTRLFNVSYVDSTFRTERIFARRPTRQSVLNELAMPMEKFVDKYGLNLLRELFIALTDSQAYGVYRSTPAVYHMSWMAPQALARMGKSTIPCGKYDSFQAIADRLGDWLGNKVTFRLGVPIVEVRRRHEGCGGVMVVEGDSGAMSQFDRVIVTARLPKTGRRLPIVMPMSSSEQTVANTLQELQVYSALIEGPRSGALDTRFAAIDYGAVKRADNSRWWVALNCEKRNVSNTEQFRDMELTTRASFLFYYDERDCNRTVLEGAAEREANLKREMKKWDDTEWRIVRSRQSDAYFQRWDTKGVRRGLPWTVSSMQGRGGVYYVNAGTCGFESVGNVFDCSFHMVDEHF